uniref:Uncharacterized protein n=1 Tax=Plectus sambesii TaxID=2011161 RepID=A0A914VJH5_9BILA
MFNNGTGNFLNELLDKQCSANGLRVKHVCCGNLTRRVGLFDPPLLAVILSRSTALVSVSKQPPLLSPLTLPSVSAMRRISLLLICFIGSSWAASFNRQGRNESSERLCRNQNDYCRFTYVRYGTAFDVDGICRCSEGQQCTIRKRIEPRVYYSCTDDDSVNMDG